MFSLQSINSKESLDEFLPMFHNKDYKKTILYQKEQNIVKYLKTLGLVMKTDPLLKQQEHYKNVKIIEVYVNSQQEDESFEEDKNISTTEVSPSEINGSELSITRNPLLQKGRKLELQRKHSFQNLVIE